MDIARLKIFILMVCLYQLKKIGLASEAYLLLATRQGIKPLSGIELSADKDLNILKTNTTNSNYFTIKS